jgi:hypothetical protein
MEVPEDVLQVPLSDIFVALGVIEKGWSDLPIEGVPIVESCGIELDDLSSDLVITAPAMASDEGGLSQKIHLSLQVWVHLACNTSQELRLRSTPS